MQNRSGSFGEEVADQIGIFLSVVTGFIVAQGWNTAFMTQCLPPRVPPINVVCCSKERKAAAANPIDDDDDEEPAKDTSWYPWVYAVAATAIALTIMTVWGYFVASRLYRPSARLQQARLEARGQTSNGIPLLKEEP